MNATNFLQDEFTKKIVKKLMGTTQQNIEHYGKSLAYTIPHLK